MPRLLPTLFALAMAALTLTTSQPLSADEPAKKSAKLRLTLLDEATGKPLPRGWATLYPVGEVRTYRNELRPDQEKKEAFLQFEVEPGNYSIYALQRAGSINGFQFDPVETPKNISLEAGDSQELTIMLRARLLTPQEIEDWAPMVAIGRVVDPQGKPLPNVEVHVATGWGTLLGGGQTHTDSEGEYVLRFGPGIAIADSKSQLQAAQFSVVDDRYLEVSRSHDFKLMAYEISPDLEDHKDLDNIVVKGTPARLDFVLSEPAVIEAHFVDQSDNEVAALPVDLTSPQSEDHEYRYRRSIKPQAAGHSAARRWEAVPGRPWRFETASARSPAMTFPTPGRYVVALREHPPQDDDAAWLEIVEVQQTNELPLTSVAFSHDPFASPPLSKRDRRAAQEFLQQMAAPNERWLKGPSKELGEYSYRFQFKKTRKGELQSSDVAVKPGDRQHGKHQGIAYDSAIHRLAANPDDVIIRAFDAGPERTTIAYSFRQPAGQAMGTGVADSWAGYFSRQTVNGTLTVDSKRLVPLEWHDDECRETFSDFVEIAPDQFVPQRIKIAKQDAMQFDWRFKWRPEGLWLFHESRDVDTDEVIASVENVRIGSKAGKGEAPAEPPVREAD